MMWPRLRLLHELLSPDGSFWMTLDDNEVARARAMLDEIFGQSNFVATCIWHKADSPKNTAKYFSSDHDYVLVYAKDKSAWRPNFIPRSEEMLARYRNPDKDRRGAWMISDLDARNYYSKGTYPIQIPGGALIPGHQRVGTGRFQRRSSGSLMPTAGSGGARMENRHRTSSGFYVRFVTASYRRPCGRGRRSAAPDTPRQN
jgi:hypothetical protein